jgi:hypothetical protein
MSGLSIVVGGAVFTPRHSCILSFAKQDGRRGDSRSCRWPGDVDDVFMKTVRSR